MIRKDGVYLFFLLLLGAFLRLDLLIANKFVLDSDEAIVGLMANHIIDGKGIPTFYYGQHYMGSLEAILAAVLFSIFGPSAVALKAVPLIFSLVLIVLIYALAFNAAGKNAARIAALLCAVPPSALVIWSSMARGGFIEIVVLGALAFLVLQRWLKENENSLTLVAVIGFILGIGWWVNNQILYFMFPVAFCMLGKILWLQKPIMTKLQILTKVACVGLFFWFLGGSPYWIYNIRNNWASLGMFEPAKASDVSKYFQGFYNTALPILLGGSRFWQGEDVFPGSKSITSLVYSVLLFSFFILRRKEIGAAFIARIYNKNCLLLFLLLLLTCTIIFISSSFGWLSQAPRYLLPMYVGIFVICGSVLSVLLGQSRIIGLTVLSIILFCNLSSSYWGGRSIPGEPIVFRGDRVSKDHTDLILWLKQNSISWVRTNYWIGYRLAFETSEAVKFIVNQEPSQTRIEEWPEEAKNLAIDKMPLVMVPSQARFIRKALELLHYTYEEKVISGYHVFYKIQSPQYQLRILDRSQMQVSSELNSAVVASAIDGNDETRWGSGRHQEPGMQFEVKLKNPVELKAIRYRLGKWPQDYPRGLQIEFEKPNGEKVLFFDNTGWEAIRYLLEMQSEILLYTKPEQVSKIIFTQTGKHQILDWSIAEIEVLY